MRISELLTGGLGVALILFLIVYAIISFLLPFFVHGISLQAKRTNQLLEQLLAQTDQAAADAGKEAQARSYQAEVSIALLRNLKETSDTLLTHAQYQTEVTKHQLAVESVQPANADSAGV